MDQERSLILCDKPVNDEYYSSNHDQLEQSPVYYDEQMSKYHVRVIINDNQINTFIRLPTFS